MSRFLWCFRVRWEGLHWFGWGMFGIVDRVWWVMGHYCRCRVFFPLHWWWFPWGLAWRCRFQWVRKLFSCLSCSCGRGPQFCRLWTQCGRWWYISSMSWIPRTGHGVVGGWSTVCCFCLQTLAPSAGLHPFPSDGPGWWWRHSDCFDWAFPAWVPFSWSSCQW